MFELASERLKIQQKNIEEMRGDIIRRNEALSVLSACLIFLENQA